MEIYGLNDYGFNKQTDFKIENGIAVKATHNEALTEECVQMVYFKPPFSKYNLQMRKRPECTGYDAQMNYEQYLSYIEAEIRRFYQTMTDSAVMYVHTNMAVSAYVKVIMDRVFGMSNFVNEIIRLLPLPKSYTKPAFVSSREVILLYSKTEKYIFNELHQQLSEDEIEKKFKKTDSLGRRYHTLPLYSSGITKKGSTGEKWRDMLPPEGSHWRTDPKELDAWDKEGLIEWYDDSLPRKKVYLDDIPGKRYTDIWSYRDDIETFKTMLESVTEQNDTVLICAEGQAELLKCIYENHRKFIGIFGENDSIDTIVKSFDNLQLSL